jgi:hypothetical protein
VKNRAVVYKAAMQAAGFELNLDIEAARRITAEIPLANSVEPGVYMGRLGNAIQDLCHIIKRLEKLCQPLCTKNHDDCIQCEELSRACSALEREPGADAALVEARALRRAIGILAMKAAGLEEVDL